MTSLEASMHQDDKGHRYSLSLLVTFTRFHSIFCCFLFTFSRLLLVYVVLCCCLFLVLVNLFVFVAQPSISTGSLDNYAFLLFLKFGCFLIIRII